jgi:putative ABC transport system permease protein
LNILTTFLMIMATLMAVVGSIGLMGTMSLNVMERTREIGVMRAIGASDRIITKMVIVEGLIIGLISWLAGCLLSVPIGKVMSDVISSAIFSAPIAYTFILTGVIIWLVLVLLLSALASILPARSATRLTIREVLAYE